MELAVMILKLVKDLPTAVSIALSGLAIVIVGWAHFRKVDMAAKTSTSSIENQQIETLMKQIKLLIDELTQARHQLAEIHNQNIHLMEQLRSANQRISELEITVANSKRGQLDV